VPYTNPVTVTFTPSSGTASTVTALYAGLSFAGGFQVNVTLPADLKPGEYNVSITTQGKTSPNGVTLSVGP
jgi:uncharacterized protein (TIGR03437 family)